ncbi:MAG: YceI family protein [Bacteroidales bacterium]|nr:YceI family protein [Bacteroidales bacterium]
MKKYFLFIALVLGISVGKTQETKQEKIFCDKSQSSITYSMNHPLHSWTGESTEINSVILSDQERTLITQVAVSVKIASFDSKNANRDSHAMEVTEAILYPSLSFISSQIVQKGEQLEVTGTLKFHNIEQSISFIAEKKMESKKARITGEFSIKMTDYQVEPSSLMGMSTDDEIKISFSMLY